MQLYDPLKESLRYIPSTRYPGLDTNVNSSCSLERDILIYGGLFLLSSDIRKLARFERNFSIVLRLLKSDASRCVRGPLCVSAIYLPNTVTPPLMHPRPVGSTNDV